MAHDHTGHDRVWADDVTRNQKLAIVAILSALAAIGSCTILFTPGQFGMTP